jgi:hypothetical protein
MRHPVRLFALAALLAIPSSLLAQSIYFKVGSKEEKWDVNDPFSTAKSDITKAYWKDKSLTLDDGHGSETSRKVTAITRIVWPNEPVPLAKAREHVSRGEPTPALQLIEPVLRLFDPVRKVPGSLWLKAAEVKLDALSQLSNDAVLAAFITVLEEADDGSVPGLAGKIKLSKLDRRVRAGDNAAVLEEADKLLAELSEPDMQARLTITKGDALLATRKYEDALNTYLRVPVFLGAEKKFVPSAYLGAAKSLRALDTPFTHAQRLDLTAIAYLKEIIRDYPLSKEAGIARGLLPREERAAEDNRALGGDKQSPVETEKKPAETTDAKPEEKTEAKPAAEKPATEESK